MNLIDLIKRRDRPLEKSLVKVEGVIEPCNADFEGFRMRGLRLSAGSSFRLARFTQYQELRHHLPRDWGWAVALEKQGLLSRGQTLTAVCTAVENGRGDEVARTVLSSDDRRWHWLRFDWRVGLKDHPEAEFLFQIVGNGGAVVLGISEHLDLRGPLFAYARGRGLEIGPGLQPQIRPAPGVDIRYLEQSPIEEWQQLYNRSGRFKVDDEIRALCDRYIVGDGQRLDVVEDESLDFIFSSHVFEHLPNPLGTLESWGRKLRRGGHVIGVVPDCNNCFDLLQPPSPTALWMEEWEQGRWQLQDYHYEKWCRYTQPWASAATLKAKGFSVHAHYYTPKTFGGLLEGAVQRVGYSNFHVRSVRNHKDFGFLLQK
jgi:SAM-dependent methyltransferase